MSVHARRLAGAIKGAAARHAERHGPGRFRATVVAWDSQQSFELDPHGLDVTLDDGDVTLGQTVRRYDADVGIAAGDALILIEISEGDFVAVDIESDHP